MNEIRKEEQRTFYNRWRTGGREIAPNMKYYSIVDSREKFLANWFMRNATKRRVLDYGCGSGGSARKIAEYGAAEVIGVDISEDSITNAKKEIEATNLKDRCRFFVMDAENMTFEENRFDIVYSAGVLHHIDLNRAYPEVARVLKPSGQMICVEPLAYNPLIQWYRKRTPHLRTSWEIEHILTKNDIYLGKRYFNKLKILGFFYLMTIAAVPFRKTPIFGFVRDLLELFDRFVLNIPFIQWYAWQVVFALSEPRKEFLGSYQRKTN
jgi:ubiquinone/menaquinone biosynthesis C-methylase UbiE